MGKKRKAVVFVNDSTESKVAVQLIDSAGIPYVTYHVNNFEEGCCAELSVITTPSVFAAEGIFKGIEGIKDYISLKNNDKSGDEPESAYW